MTEWIDQERQRLLEKLHDLDSERETILKMLDAAGGRPEYLLEGKHRKSRLQVSNEELAAMYMTKTAEEIGKQYGVTRFTVYQRLRRAGIKKQEKQA